MKLALRTRLTLGSAGLLAVALLAFLGAARYVSGQVLWERLDRMLIEQAEEVSRRMILGEPIRPEGPPQFRPDGPGPNGPPGFPPARRDELGLLRPPRRWRFDGNEQSVAWAPLGFEVARTGQPHWDEVNGEEEGSRLRVYSTPVFAGQEQIGIVQTAIPIGPTEAALASVTYSLLVLLPVIGLVAVLGGMVLTRRALAPVRQLTETAAQIAPSSLSQRLPEPGGGDEFDALTKMLNGMLGRLDDGFTRQKQFTSHASHELRTPLASLKMALGLLQRSDLPPALQKEALQGANDAVDRANRLISDLLLLTRTDNGQLPVRRTEVVVQEALEAAVQQARAGHSDPIAAPVLISTDQLTLHTDRDLLLRLVSNLVSNALRHTPAEGRIEVRLVQNTLTVADTGGGIAPEHLERLGQPFYRPDVARAREDGGVGLGLSICHGIARTLGGTLTLASTPGQGTAVTVSLPHP